MLMKPLGSRQCSDSSMCLNSLNSHKVGTIIMICSLPKDEGTETQRGHRASKWEGYILNPGSLVSKPVLLPVIDTAPEEGGTDGSLVTVAISVTL